MSFLSRFMQRKPKVAPVTKAITANDVTQMPEAALVSFLNDENQPTALRSHAVSQLPYGQALLNASKESAHTPIQLAAFKRLSQLIDSKVITLDQLSSAINNTNMCLSIVAYCQHGEFTETLLAGYSSQESLSELVLQSSSSKTRQAAVLRVTDEALLLNIQKVLKSKDKTVYKIAKDKLDVLREAQRQHQVLLSSLSAVCEKLERLVTTIDENTFEERFQQLQQQWRKLKEQTPSTDFDEQYNAANNACQTRLNRLLAAVAEEREQAQAIETAKQSYLDTTLALQTSMAELYTLNSFSETERQQQQNTLKTLQEQWQKATLIQPASQQQEKQWQQLVTHSNTLNDLLLTHGTLTELVASLNTLEDDADKMALQNNINSIIHCASALPETLTPAIVSQTKASIAAFVAAYQQQAQQAQDAVRHIGSLIRKAATAAEQGNLRHAMGIRQSIERKHKEIETLPSRLIEKLTDLDEAINKLQDYRNFATEPKKHSLIEAMQVLANQAISYTEATEAENDNTKANSSFDAIDQADQIKKLQSDWKELVYGGKDTQPELWEQFHALAQTAYEPCKAHFSDKSAERKENLNKRKLLVSELETYVNNYDWTQANWKSVEEIVRTAKKQWQGYFPVDRSANKPVENTFRQVIDSIQAYIDAAYEIGKTSKQTIVDQAKQLDELPSADAIEQVKSLQSQWKESGRTWQRAERALWKEFKTLCDAVFNKKQAENDAFKLELNQHAEQANAICEQIEKLADTLGDNAQKELSALKENFNAIGNLPHKAKPGIHSRFNNAVETVNTAIQQQRAQAAKQTWLDVFAIKAQINQLQLEHISGSDNTELRHSINTSMAAITQWPNGSKQAINKALNQQCTSTLPQNNSQALRLLCIHAEIISEKDSPDSDKALRMEYQMNRLQASLSGASTQKNITSQLADVYVQWLESDAVEASDYAVLEQRLLGIE